MLQRLLNLVLVPLPSRFPHAVFWAAAIVLCSRAMADNPEPATAAATGLLPLPEYGGDLAARRYLSGDWHGTRSDLAERGFTFDLTWTQVLQGVVDGGVDRGTRYGGHLEGLYNLDLDRTGVLPGALLSIRSESRYGDSVNAMAGTLLPVNDVLYFPLTSPADEDIVLALTEVRYTQFVSRQLGFFAGKFITLGGDANEFAGGRGDTQFLAHSFTSASVTSLFNPYSTIGGGVMYMPTPHLTLSSAVYASSDSSTSVGFDTLDDGLVWSTTLAGQYQVAARPGGMRLTFQYAWDNDFVDLRGPFVTDGGFAVPRQGDSWCVYWNGWQYLYVEEDPGGPINVADGRTDLQGLGVFARAAIADHDTNPVDWLVSGGVGGRGPLPGREHDSFGIGYAYANNHEAPIVSQTVLNDHSSRFEAYYTIAITPAAELTFDFQVADSILAGVDAATLFGLRFRVSF